MRARRRRRFAPGVVLVATLAIGIPNARVARAESTEEALQAAQAEIEQLQREADRLAASYAEAWDASARLEDQIIEVEARIAANRRSLGGLRESMRDLALNRYVAASAPSGVAALDASSMMDSARRAEMLSIVNDKGIDTLDTYRVAREDLASLLSTLDNAQQSQREFIEDLDSAGRAVEQKLTELRDRQAELEVQYATELEAARLEAARRAARQRAAEQRAVEQRADEERSAREQSADANPDRANSGGDSSGTGEVATPAPVSGNLGVTICPINGPVSFTDTWGDARSGGRSHQGVDLLSPAGTPNVAVTSGRIEQDYGARQGNGVFLIGDNGNTYYYFHLSAYEGAERRVAQGEVIGYVGSTGASGANHTHFEIHPGGGAAVNPYPYVRPVC